MQVCSIAINPGSPRTYHDTAFLIPGVLCNSIEGGEEQAWGIKTKGYLESATVRVKGF